MTRGAAEIRRVAELALFKVNLPENVAKESWKRMSRSRLFWLLLIEVWELGVALRRLHQLRRGAGYYMTPEEAEAIEAARRNVHHEAGDVVAFCAFLVDRT